MVATSWGKKTEGNIVTGFGEWVMDIFGSLLLSLSHLSALSWKTTVRINVCYFSGMKTRVAYAERGIRFCLTDESKSRHVVQGWEGPSVTSGTPAPSTSFLSSLYHTASVSWAEMAASAPAIMPEFQTAGR